MPRAAMPAQDAATDAAVALSCSRRLGAMACFGRLGSLRQRKTQQRLPDNV